MKKISIYSITFVLIGIIIAPSFSNVFAENSSYDYVIFENSTGIYSQNGTTENIDYFGTDGQYVIQNTINALNSTGGSIKIKKGNFIVDGLTLWQNISLDGDKAGNIPITKIQVNSSSVKTGIQIKGGNVNIDGITIYSKGGQRTCTSCDGLLLNGSRIHVNDVFISNQYNNIHQTSSGITSFNNIESRNAVHDHVLLDGAQQGIQFYDKVVMDTDSGFINAVNGFEVKSTGELQIHDVSELRAINGFTIDAGVDGNGGGAQDIHVSDSDFDSNIGQGISMYSSGTNSIISHVEFTNVWASSNGNNGISINTFNGGKMFSVHCVACVAINNGRYGVSASGFKDFVLTSSTITDNSVSAPNTYDDVLLYNMYYPIVSSNVIGTLYGTVNAKYGVHLAGSEIQSIISNNNFVGMIGKAIADNSTVGSTTLKVNNMGT